MHDIDLFVNYFFALHRTAPLTEWLYVFTNIFNTVPFTIVIICVSVLVYLVRGRQYATLFAITSAGGALSVYLLKILLQVARPTGGVFVALGESFPSGHATMAAVFFVILIFVFDDYLSGFRKHLFNALCIVGLFLVAFSRVYLGVHWTSDVIGGIFIGTIYTYLATEIFRAAEKV